MHAVFRIEISFHLFSYGRAAQLVEPGPKQITFFILAGVHWQGTDVAGSTGSTLTRSTLLRVYAKKSPEVVTGILLLCRI
jgi:hypothetical protein